MRNVKAVSWSLSTVVVSITAVVATVVAGGVPSALFAGTAAAQAVGTGPCGLTQPALCQTFDQAAGTGNRSGQLDGTLWGVSRTIGLSNLGQGQYDAATPTQLKGCNSTTVVQPPNDIIICNGQLREATNDGESVTSLAMYPKQPFDFAGRTGVVSFDVSNDDPGIHKTWPEFWITDQPVPAPFTHFESWLAVPRNGVGLRFAAGCTGCYLAPACPIDGKPRWTADSAVVVRNYVTDGSRGPGENPAPGAISVTPLDCVTSSDGMAGSLNHVEIHVSQSQIDVYATDAGTTAPLHHIAVIQNANLSLTRGLIWLEDVHYNAHKFGGQAQHTFAWDNVGFDGPVLPRDLAFDALDALQTPPNYPGMINLGWSSSPGAGPQLSIPGISGISNASAALLTFNFMASVQPSTLAFAVNGHAHTVTLPKPPGLNTNGGMSPSTLAVPVPIGDVVAGTNTLTLSTDQAGVVANVDLVLVGAGGLPGGAPTPVPVATNSPVPSASSTPVPSATNTPVPSACAVSVVLDGKQMMVSRPLSFCTNQG